MKVAFYIVQDTTQVVLTPETEWERNVAKQLLQHQGRVRVFEGQFYACQGGWYRHGAYGDKSVMLRLDAPESEVAGVPSTERTETK